MILPNINGRSRKSLYKKILTTTSSFSNYISSFNHKFLQIMLIVIETNIFLFILLPVIVLLITAVYVIQQCRSSLDEIIEVVCFPSNGDHEISIFQFEPLRLIGKET